MRSEPHSGREDILVDLTPAARVVLGRCVWSSPRPVSTGQLHTLRCFHFRPINPLVWAGALPG